MFRFGEFLFNPETGDLQGPDRTGRMRPQTARVLTLLLENPGAFVSRGRIAAALWNGDTHVDERAGISVIVRELREQLNDDASSPRYVASAPKRGYRLITPVEVVGAAASAAEPVRPRPARLRLVALVATAGLISGLAWAIAGRPANVPQMVVEVNADAEASRLVNVLPMRDAAIAQLTAPAAAARIGVVSPFDAAGMSVTILRQRHIDWLLHAAVQHLQGRLVMHAKLVRVGDNRVVWSLNQEVEPARFAESYRLFAAEMAAAAIASASLP